MAEITEAKKKQLYSLGFHLVDISDKNWIVVADPDGFTDSCFVLNDETEIDKLLALHEELSKKTE